MAGEQGRRMLKRDESNLNPYKLLCVGLIRQSILDMRPTRARENPMRAIEASLFLTECGPQFAEAAGWAVDPRHWEEALNGQIK
jgi:hypothetical protein